MEVQEVKEQLKSIFRQVINNNKVDNWNEQDHPRDEQGKFTEKGGGSAKEKEITRDYHLMRSNDYVKATERDNKKEILFTNDDETWLLTEVQDKGWELVKAGKVVKTFDDKYEADEAWEQGYFADVDSMDKKYDKQGYLINNNKETDMVLLDELKKLINKVENTKGEKDMEIDNEKVDKRDIIRQIMAIAGKEEASEDVKTIAKLAEKLAYDKSEAGTADNEKEEDKKECDNKKEVKNEDEKDEKKVKEIKEEVKEDVTNKCKNSVDNSKPDYFGRLNEIYNAATSNIEQKTEYVSRADREKAAEDYFAK